MYVNEKMIPVETPVEFLKHCPSVVILNGESCKKNQFLAVKNSSATLKNSDQDVFQF
jgi:hypothetical protein